MRTRLSRSRKLQVPTPRVPFNGSSPDICPNLRRRGTMLCVRTIRWYTSQTRGALALLSIFAGRPQVNKGDPGTVHPTEQVPAFSRKTGTAGKPRLNRARRYLTLVHRTNTKRCAFTGHAQRAARFLSVPFPHSLTSGREAYRNKASPRIH